VWFLTFAAHQSGLNKIVRCVRPITLPQIRAEVLVERSFFRETYGLRRVLCKYGAPLGSSKQVLGYGGLASPVIFQHGCPNNVPLIFWVRPSRRSRTKWNPLFSNRRVSSDVYPLFTEDFARQAMPEELWMAGYFEFALNVLEKIDRSKEGHQLLFVLGLLAKGRSVDRIRSTLVSTDAEFNGLLGELRGGGLIDANNVVTRYGFDVVSRASKPGKKSALIREETNFYPSSFLGFQREA